LPLHKRYKKLVELKARSLMSYPAITLPINSSLYEVVETMYREKIGSVIIVDGGGKITGIITERDIIYAASRGLFKTEDIKAESLMNRSVVTVNEESSIYEVIDKMRAHNIRHLPVIDGQGKPVGVISLRDLIDFSVSLLKILMLPEEG
jgi:Predicted transcriptional regulator, contains C-terminal CBS domains